MIASGLVNPEKVPGGNPEKTILRHFAAANLHSLLRRNVTRVYFIVIMTAS